MDVESPDYEQAVFSKLPKQASVMVDENPRDSPSSRRSSKVIISLSMTVLLLVALLVVTVAAMAVMGTRLVDPQVGRSTHGKPRTSTQPSPTRADDVCSVYNPCQNQGVCKPSGPDGYLCDCQGLWWGQNCTVCGGQSKIVTAEVVRETYTRTISVPIITENCTPGKEAPQYTVLMRRKDGSVDFFRNWVEYKEGFGDIENEFWIGNENMCYLTNNGTRYRLRVDLRTFSGEHGYAEYDGFTVGPEVDKYKLTLGAYRRGNAGDSLGLHRGRRFTTYDVAGHNESAFCAGRFQAAWWYETCFRAQLTGPYSFKANVPHAMGVIWRNFKGFYESLEFAEMKIF